MPGLRVGKADKEDIELTRDFLKACDMFWDNRTRYSCRDIETEWLEWDDEDDDKQELLRIRKGLSEDEGCDEEDVDNRLIIFEFIKRKYKRADCNWMRVVLAADLLIDNVCDPTEDHLAFHPSFEQFHVANEQ